MGRRITKLKKLQTDGKASKGALSESETKYQQLFATVSDAIMLFDAETKQFVDVNDAALDLYGYSKEEFLELRHPDITSEPEESEASNGSHKLDIFLTDGDFYLGKIPFETISDLEIVNKAPSSSITMRRSSVQFRKLTHYQISQLESFIQNYTVGEV
jgi:PAS domain-containing protein